MQMQNKLCNLDNTCLISQVSNYVSFSRNLKKQIFAIRYERLYQLGKKHDLGYYTNT